MNQIRPFRGWHYTGDVSKLIAPPYDILSGQDKQALLAGSADNIVAVDMPHFPPKELGPQEEYDDAARKLQAMQTSGVLTQDPAPALYAYSQTYTWAGRSYTRRAIMCGVRATELCEGVWPHEKTFAGPKADRLRLTETTGVQLSPIFGFYEDTAGIKETLWRAAKGNPVACGMLNGVHESLWAVTDSDVIAKVCAAMVDRPIFIADGHHRYTTALNYRNSLREAGKIDDYHEANYVLFTLVAMDAPGLLVLPTHRMITGLRGGFGCEELVAQTRGAVRWQRVPISDALLDDADSFLRPFGPHAIAFLDAKFQAAYVGQLTDLSVMATLAPAENETWRTLDVAILQRYFLDEQISRNAAPSAQKSSPGANAHSEHGQGDLRVAYSAYGREVEKALRSGQCQMAAMLQGTPLSAVKDIALARAVMPHKSTYFYPKLATGMVLKPLT